MLHIVQVVTSGVAEKPQLFADEAKARNAYVECVRKHWEQRYSAYCDHQGISSDAFASAQAFVNTIDASEKKNINFWTFSPEEAGLSDQAVEAPEVTRLSPSAVRQGGPERAPEEYATPEWKAFVGTIKRLCAGSRNEFYLLPRGDWRQEVYSDRSSLEYWDWVADNILKYKEIAKNANYSLIEDPDSFGCYRFKNQEGIESENSCDSEWEAWCAAGLYSEAERQAASE